MKIGDKIKELRLGHNLSIQEFAKKTHIPKEYVYYIEKQENVSISTLNKIAKGLGKELIIFFK